MATSQSLKVFWNKDFSDAIIRPWAESNGYAFFETESPLSPHFRQVWDSEADEKSMGVWIGYPVDSSTDLKVVEGFLQKLRESDLPIYYSVRPNDHLPTGTVSMAGQRRMKTFEPRETWLDRQKARVLRKLEKKGLLFGRSATAPTFYERVMADRQMVIEAGDVPIELPQSLLVWPGSWQNWNPGPILLRRDLVDRVTDFFPYPRGIHVVVLNKCNLKCVMCPYHSPDYSSAHTNDYLKNKKEMSFELFRSIADYAGPRGIALQFGQIEETLLHPHIFDFIEYGKRAGVPHIHITTNGTLLTEAKAAMLANSGVTSVMFSVDAATPELYKQIRGASLSVLERNIRHFLTLAKPKGIRVSVSFILQNQAKEERAAFLDKWRALGIDQVVFYVLSKFDKKTGETLREAGAEHYEKGIRYACAAPWTQAVVFPEGEVSLCCKTLTDVGWRGVVSVGSVDAKHGFDTIWTGDSYRRVRDELLSNVFNDFPVCKKCEIWSASTSLSEDTPTYSRQYNETCETITFKVVKTESYNSSSGTWERESTAQIT